MFNNSTLNLIQAPLAGVSNTPFRELLWTYSEPRYACTEMISCKTIIHDLAFAAKRFINKSPIEKKLCVQLSSDNPQEVAEAVKRVTDLGADVIDLNCGCPKKKIRSKGTGSKLLTDPQKLFHLITAMKQHTHVPVSVKIRVDSDSGDKFNMLVAKSIADAGADFVVVHGRHWTARYDVPCNYDEIQFFVETLKIPIIGNGDIACADSLKKMFATGCAGAMIGRAGVGQPWLIQQLQTELSGEKFIKPTLQEIGQIFLTHVAKLIELLQSEKFAVLQARTFAKYYARDLPARAQFCELVNQCEDYARLEVIVNQFMKGRSD